MDKISRIKKLVKSSLDTSFGGNVIISEIIILPTQKFDDKINQWVPDSFTIFLSIQKPDDPKLNEEIYSIHGRTDVSTRITNFLESLLGFEVCVDVV